MADLDKEVQLGPIDVDVGDVELGAVELKDGASNNRATVDVNGRMSFKVFDKDGNGVSSTDEGGGVRSLDVSIKSGVTTYEVVGIKDIGDARINPAKEDGNLATIKTNTDKLDVVLSTRATEATLFALSTKIPGDPAREGGKLTVIAADTTSLNTKIPADPAREGGNLAAIATDTGVIAADTTSLDTKVPADPAREGGNLATVAADTTSIDTKIPADPAREGGNLATVAADTTSIDTKIPADPAREGGNLAAIATDTGVIAADTTSLDTKMPADPAREGGNLAAILADTTSLDTKMPADPAREGGNLAAIKAAVEILDDIVDPQGFANVDTPTFCVDNMEDDTDWSVTDAGTNKAQSTTHLVGQYSVSFDKTTGNVRAGIKKTLSPVINLGDHAAHYVLRFLIYIPSLTNLIHTYCKIGTDASNYHEYTKLLVDLRVGWNVIVWSLVNGDSTQTGNGMNTSSISHIEIGIQSQAVGNTFTGIAIDEIVFAHLMDTSVFSTPTTDVDLGAVAIKSGTTAVKADVEVDSTKKAIYVRSESIVGQTAFDPEDDYSSHLNPGSNPVLTLDTKGKPNVEVWAKSIAGGKTVKIYGSRDNSNFRHTYSITTDASTKEATKGFFSGYRYVRIELVETGTGTSELEISAQR